MGGLFVFSGSVNTEVAKCAAVIGDLGAESPCVLLLLLLLLLVLLLLLLLLRQNKSGKVRCDRRLGLLYQHRPILGHRQLRVEGGRLSGRRNAHCNR